ncbi:hypothetical protein CDAR_417411 [Caerostris darwini]|uniref:Uncharacterized protein n=1 Tax=Caerostris darwini TaxID=1538125 RepID=A0AAV4X9B8_9ARAC|nr:hypothetical protein CDAR_417411 [Caerostris darwini]
MPLTTHYAEIYASSKCGSQRRVAKLFIPQCSFYGRPSCAALVSQRDQKVIMQTETAVLFIAVAAVLLAEQKGFEKECFRNGLAKIVIEVAACGCPILIEV